MFAFSKELCPPSGIEDCTFANFTGPHDQNLIVAKHTVLEVYRLDKGAAKVLSLITKYSLFGNIQSLSAIKFSRTTDCLILTFKDAKASILEWDPAINDISVVSMHYYEELKSRIESGVTSYFCPPLVRVDPDNRCAAVLCYDEFLAIIPFCQSRDEFIPTEKSPQYAKVLPTYVIELSKIDPNLCIDHVKDITFLEGYSLQPTICVLHEPRQTWAGRAQFEKDTCVVTAISLDLVQERHPVIWTVTNLPFDCFYLLPVPKPTGGVLVMSTNSIFACNQNIKYQLGLNKFVPQHKSSSYVTELVDVYIALDTARFAFLSKDRFIASLKGGELYIFSIVAVGDSISKITISKGSASVISSCICTTSEKYFFLGSRIGDSVLVEYQEMAVANKVETIENIDSPMKLQKIGDGTAKPIVSNASDFDMAQDIEAFYSSNQKKTQKKDFVFSKVDSIINIGPIGDFCFGSCSDRKREEFSQTEKALPADPEEIVACTGHGKNGAITILQRGVRPSVTISFQLPNCQRIWTLTEYDAFAEKPETGKRSRDASDDFKKDHTVILVSTETSSMVLTAKDELVEITGHDELAFFVDLPTFNAGNFNNGKFLLQIGEHSVLLLGSAFTLIDKVSFNDSIIDSLICDPYVLLSFGPSEPFVILFLNDNGKLEKQPLAFLNDKEENSQMPSTPLEPRDNIVSFCLYKDTTELPLCLVKPEPKSTVVVKEETVKPENEVKDEEMAENLPIKEESVTNANDEDSDSDDDEFAALYGDASDSKPNTNPEDQKVNSSLFDGSDSDLDDDLYGDSVTVEKATTNKSEETPTKIQSPPKYYCFLTRESGALEIHCITKSNDHISSELYFTAPRFSRGIPMLCNNLIAENVQNLPVRSTNKPQQKQTSRLITEIKVCLLGSNELPFLFAFTDFGDLYIYGSFHYQTELRFYRFHHKLILRPFHMLNTTTENELIEAPPEPRGQQRLYEFNHGNKTGIFIAGLNPHWIFCERSYLRIFPMTSEHFIDCYASFNNTEFCPDGFIYSVKNNVNISRLSPSMNYEHSWALRKIPLKQGQKHYTPHHICYHAPTRSFVIAVSYRELSTDAEMNRPDQSGGLPRFHDKHELFLLDMSNGAKVVNHFPLEDNEHVVSLCAVDLNVKSPTAEKTESRPLIAVGTAYVLGEDEPCKGRIFIFDIITQRSDDNSISLRIKHLMDKTEKGPISAVNSVVGYLVIAIGPKILIHSFETGKELVGKGFFDTQMFVVSIKTLKHFIIVADMYNSVYFLIWKRLLRELSLLGKDYGHLHLTEAEFLIDNDNLGIFIADRSENIQVMSFDPNNINSRAGGKMLIPASEYHLGETVIRAQKTRIFAREGVHFGNVFVTTSGSIGIIGTLNETAYNCLLTLQAKMLNGLPHYAGLNPKAFRKYRAKIKQLRPRNNTILDIDMLMRYNSLGSGFQKEFANLVKSSPEEIFQYLDLTNIASTIC